MTMIKVDQFHYIKWRKIQRQRVGNSEGIRCPKNGINKTQNIRMRVCRVCSSHQGEELGGVLCLTDIRWGNEQ